MSMDSPHLLSLAGRVEAGERSNELDVLIEVAVFRPCDSWASVRSNAAGTKVIYTDTKGVDKTHWAANWSHDPAITLESLRASQSHSQTDGGRRERPSSSVRDVRPVRIAGPDTWPVVDASDFAVLRAHGAGEQGVQSDASHRYGVGRARQCRRT